MFGNAAIGPVGSVGSVAERPARTRSDQIKAGLLIFVNPGGALKGALAQLPIPVALGISGTAFGLFFLQTGLDLLRVSQPTLPRLAMTGAGGVVGLCLVGVVYGTLGVAFLAALAWIATRPLGATVALDSTIRAFALGYCPALVYAALGVATNLALGWNTALAVGVTGMLWALGPMIATLREMLGGRIWPSVILATLLGGLTLFGWAFLGT
jgi:uncharacterized membrane protein